MKYSLILEFSCTYCSENLKVGYEQYTAIELVNIPKETLIDWGVYPNKENNTQGKFNFSSLNISNTQRKLLYLNNITSFCYLFILGIDQEHQ